MNKVIAFLFSFLAASAFANEQWRPTARFLDAVCQIESSGGRFLHGDGGLSLGHFQIQKAAWADVSEWRRKRNLQTHDYQENVLNPEINRSYAADYLVIIHNRLKQHYGREPSPSELYAAYNIGMGNFRKCNYDLSRINKLTAAKCRQVEDLLR